MSRKPLGKNGNENDIINTQNNFKTAFYRAPITDNNSVEQWQSEGSCDHAQRCNARYKKLLAEYQAPAIDPAVDEALLAFIEQRKSSMPDAFV